MEEDIQNYLLTVMFCGTPCIWYNKGYVISRDPSLQKRQVWFTMVPVTQ